MLSPGAISVPDALCPPCTAHVTPPSHIPVGSVPTSQGPRRLTWGPCTRWCPPMSQEGRTGSLPHRRPCRGPNSKLWAPLPRPRWFSHPRVRACQHQKLPHHGATSLLQCHPWGTLPATRQPGVSWWLWGRLGPDESTGPRTSSTNNRPKHTGLRPMVSPQEPLKGTLPCLSVLSGVP
jgi:hypothetical protein